MPERILKALEMSATVVAAIVALSLWGARLEYQVGERATREEVVQLRNELQQVHAEARTIRLILCDGAPKDSYCRTGQ
jgi:hypothetical protein